MTSFNDGSRVQQNTNLNIQNTDIYYRHLKKSLLSANFANREMQPYLTRGFEVKRPRASVESGLAIEDVVDTYAQGSINAVAQTQSQLTVNGHKRVSFGIAESDNIQIGRGIIITKYMDRGYYLLMNVIDVLMFAQTLFAQFTIDDGNFAGGTAGNPVAITEDNTVKVINKMKSRMRIKRMHDSSTSAEILQVYVQESYLELLGNKLNFQANQIGTKTIEEGFTGQGKSTMSPVSPALGVLLYSTPNLTSTADLTVTVPSTSGKILTIDSKEIFYSTSDSSAVNTIALKSGTATVETTQQAIISYCSNLKRKTAVEFTAPSTSVKYTFNPLQTTDDNPDRQELSSLAIIVAVKDGSSTNKIKMTMEGISEPEVAATNGISLTDYSTRTLATLSGSIDLVMQQNAGQIWDVRVPGFLTNYDMDILFAIGTFPDGRKRFLQTKTKIAY